MNVLSALLLVLSYPPFNFWWLAWLGLIPLFTSLTKTKDSKQSFLRGYLFGFLFWLGTIGWVGYVTIFGALMLILYLSLYSGIFGWIFWRLWKKKIRDFRFILLISGAWTILEWIRSHLFTGFGWNLLAYSQAPNLPVIQIADLVGAFGVSFLVVWVNGALFLARSWELGAGSKGKIKSFFSQLLAPSSQLTFLLVILVCSYGFYRLNEKIPTIPVSIAVIQGNVPQDIKWEDQYREALFQRYELLTKTATLDHPQLVIWPETSIVEDFSNPEIQNRIAGIAREANSFLLVGAPWSSQTSENGKCPPEAGLPLQPKADQPQAEAEKIENKEDIGGHYFNSAILFDPEGNLVQKYDKLHLVPYGEFIPFEKQFPFQRNWIVTGDFTSGKEHTVFTTPSSLRLRSGQAQLPSTSLRAGPAPSQVGFSVLICFEDLFPDLVRQFVKKGARLLINISNDAWFGESGAAFQHAQASVFRAVENRVPVVRATNTGFSCFIDSRGRIYEKAPPFKTGYLTAKVEIPST